jgi:hypothetical protein
MKTIFSLGVDITTGTHLSPIINQIIVRIIPKEKRKITTFLNRVKVVSTNLKILEIYCFFLIFHNKRCDETTYQELEHARLQAS